MNKGRRRRRSKKSETWSEAVRRGCPPITGRDARRLIEDMVRAQENPRTDDTLKRALEVYERHGPPKRVDRKEKEKEDDKNE